MRWRACLLVVPLLAGSPTVTRAAGELLYVTEGNRLRRIDVDTIDAPPLREDVLVERASDSEVGGPTSETRYNNF